MVREKESLIDSWLV